MFFYSITEITGRPGDSNIQPNAINNKNQVVGQVQFEYLSDAFKWDPIDGYTILPPVPGFPLIEYNSYAYDINDHGEIVGVGHDNEKFGDVATYWNKNIVKTLSVPQATTDTHSYETRAVSINEKGEIAGCTIETDRELGQYYNVQPCVWSDGQMKMLNYLNQEAYGQNASSQVITGDGQVFGNTWVGNKKEIPTRWDEKGTPHYVENEVFLHPFDPFSAVRLEQLNNANDLHVAVGTLSQVLHPSFPGYDNQAYYWTPTEFGPLGNLPSPPGFTGESEAFDINKSGQIVGYSNYRAVIWNGPVVTDLNSLIDPTLGWLLVQANCINDEGVIAGMGTLNGVWTTFVMAPIRIEIPPIYFQIMFGQISDGGGRQLIGPGAHEPQGGPFGRLLEELQADQKSMILQLLERQLIAKKAVAGKIKSGFRLPRRLRP